MAARPALLRDSNNSEKTILDVDGMEKEKEDVAAAVPPCEVILIPMAGPASDVGRRIADSTQRPRGDKAGVLRSPGVKSPLKNKRQPAMRRQNGRQKNFCARPY